MKRSLPRAANVLRAFAVGEERNHNHSRRAWAVSENSISRTVHSRPGAGGVRQHPSIINIRPSCANNDTLSHVCVSKSCLPNSFLLFQSKQIRTGVENSHFNSVGTRLPDRQVLCPHRVLEASQAGREGAGSSWTILRGDPATSAGKPSALPREEKQPRVEFLSI